jgi:hypothetical protein
MTGSPEKIRQLLEQVESALIEGRKALGEFLQADLAGVETRKQAEAFNRSWKRYRDLRGDLRNSSLGYSSVAFPDDKDRWVREDLRRMHRGELLRAEETIIAPATGRIRTFLEGLMGDAEPNYDELYDLGSEHFYSWFSGIDYAEGMREIPPVVLRAQDVPGQLTRCYDEARRCYVFGQYVAAHATLRTALEVALQDLCRAEGFLRGGEQYGKTEDHFRRKQRGRGHSRRDPAHSDAEADDYLLMPADAHFLLYGVDGKYQSMVQESRELYHELCSVVHGRRDPGKEETRVIAAEVAGLLERFYDYHQM